MKLIRFQDICTGPWARLGATWVQIRALHPWIPRLLAMPFDAFGQWLLAARLKVDNRMIQEDLTRIMGLSAPRSRYVCRRFRQNRSARLVLDKIMAKRCFTRYRIEHRFMDGADYPDTGCLFAMVHTVEPYILPAAIGGLMAEKNDPDLYLLRSPQSEQEASQFEALANWTGADRIAINYLDPASSRSIKTAVRALRTGSKLLSYIDLTAQFGRPTPVRFFNRRAWFALGALDIARLAKVPVYLCHFERHPSRESTLVLKYTRIEAGQPEMAQQVIGLLEDILLAAPENWDFTASLRSYYYQPYETN